MTHLCRHLPYKRQARTQIKGLLLPLWDWMGLLIVLFVFAADTLYLYRSNRETKRKRAGENAKLEREITTDRQQDAAFQSYLDPMAGLLQE
jgi:hypothetical protein